MSHPSKDCEVDEEMSVIFRPPIVRSGTAALDRALFSKTVDLAAAAVQDNKFISPYRKSLQAGRELLHADRISPISPHPDKALADQGRKCFLLNPSVKPEGSITHARRVVFRARVLTPTFTLTAPDTWGPVLKDGVQKQELTVIPYVLQLGYDYWNFRTRCPCLCLLHSCFGSLTC
jgi:tRNA (guanine37-N1)-methyltransferase